MITAAIWRERPIFVTSTFHDMHAERDHLRTVVFPALADRARQNGYHLHLEPVDLRWGVETSAEGEIQAKELRILKVCMDAVERSRPFLIGLLGDRYGWIPPADRIRSAASEAGVGVDVDGMSVTELEIVHGVLESPVQQPRCVFYFRELPYANVDAASAELYSDEEAGRSQEAAKLVALKERIRTQLGEGRVKRYIASWDRDGKTVAQQSVEAWGRQVEQDLWPLIEEEARRHEETLVRHSTTGPIWQQAERWALEQVIEDSGRFFVGRSPLVEELTALATSSVAADQAWAACVTGAPGAGKTALFAHLCRGLQGEDAVLLANAAGTSQKSTFIYAVLARFANELAKAIGQTPPLGEDASPAAAREAFAALFHRASKQRRVVVLLDAIDQLEPRVDAEQLGWLPDSWPASARLIVTATPGPEADAFGRRRGVRSLSLPPLRDDEAADIARAICKRYYRDLNPRVLRALVGKKHGETRPAGNALWLSLAVEELNLIDADDFSRLHAEFSGTAEERLLSLLLATVEDLPSTVAGLCERIFARAEELVGWARVHAFIDATAHSRAGWREKDLRALMPKVTGEPWDDLTFATLRRAFRGELVRRGIEGQWDFRHPLVWKVIDAGRPGLGGALQAAIAGYLLTLPKDDEIRQTETMHHLIGARDLAGAAAYYGRSDLTERELAGATVALAEHAVRGRQVAWVTSLLEVEGLAISERGLLCQRFLAALDETLAYFGAPLRTRLSVAETTRRALSRLAEEEPYEPKWLNGLANAAGKVGEILLGLGEVAEAGMAREEALALMRRFVTADPANSMAPRKLSIALEQIGDVRIRQGDLAGAQDAFEESLVLTRDWVARNREEPSRLWDLAICLGRVGNVQRQLGDLQAAMSAYAEGLGLMRRLVAEADAKPEWLRELSVLLNDVGDLQLAAGKRAQAHEAYEESVDVRRRLVALDPMHQGWLRDLTVSLNKVADLFMSGGGWAPALEMYEEGLELRRRLVRTDPGSLERIRDLHASLTRVGMARDAGGDGPGALEAFEEALGVGQHLMERDAARQREWVAKQRAVEEAMAGIAQRTSGQDTKRDRGVLHAPRGKQGSHETSRRTQSNRTYQEDLRRWKALPWFRRLWTRKPEPPQQ